jgi:anaerobic magnesium-protoporphyrin IX monomethyl ester cyclase
MISDPKIVLVYPSSQESVRTLYTFNKDQSIGFKPPQSILILATYLRANGFSDVHCLDAQVDGLSPEETVDALAKLDPDIIGITAWTDFWYPVWKTLDIARDRLPDATLVVGGPHAAIYPEETLKGSAADYIVAGDGEDVLLELVKALRARTPVPELQGLWRRDGDRVVQPRVPIAMVNDLAAIPVPDRTLLPYKKYSSVLTPSDYETTMITSRGCPYKCVFCKMDVQKVYARTAEQVVEEFRQIEALGIKDVQIYDDTFTWGHKRALDICNGIIESNIKINWAIRDRVNRVTPELYAKLKEAGCNRVHFGVETGSPRILQNSGKFMKLEQVHEGLRIAKSVNMTTMTYFMFGFLEETPEDAQMTIDLAKALNPDYASFGVLVPYPGTEIYREGLERGIIPADYWRNFALNPEPDFVIPHLIEDVMDRETLIALKDMATRNFYFRPRRLLKELAGLRSFKEFGSKVRLGTSILLDGMNASPSVFRY